MIIAIIILSVICIWLLGYLLLMKNQIRNLTKELRENRKEFYNKQLRIQLFDKDLTKLTEECNYNLDYQTNCKKKARYQEQLSRQSISDIAHDLRTPLTVVKGNLQLLQREGTLEKKEQQYLQVCQAKTEELKNMVDDFFELSMLESDNSEIELTNINITNLLMNVILEHEILIREHGFTPTIDLPEQTIIVQGNESFLIRIFGNLLGNIFKYGKEQFTVRLEELEDEYLVTFANFVEEPHKIDVMHLFERTYMADGSRSKSGTGLGLYIVKLLAEKQNATISAKLENNTLSILLHLKKEK